MGQSRVTHAKYKDAIAACDDAEYISYNVSQIATLFHVSPSGLANQLRRHYPEIIDRREAERQRLGIADSRHRGVRSWARQQYAEAVMHLRDSNDSVEETARIFNLSFTGLKQHLDFYHKALEKNRAERRSDARGCKTPGALTGNGK
ncbi:MAG: hypothetical protein K2G40_05445, partial [Muribaculaceae bacterium]|nr:hypothetical protein [Muribaculaceae bacterium]